MKTLRWLALVCSLLIVGVLIAPGPSEALPPSMTISVDGGIPATVSLTPITCTSTDTTLGYTNCYSVPTGGSYTSGTHTFTLQNYALSSLARVLIADSSGSSCSNLFSLKGVKFVPTSSFTDKATVTVVLTNTFCPN